MARSADRIAIGYFQGAGPLGYFQNAFTIYGNLLAILTEFAVRGVNLTRIESRPSRKKKWDYVFFIDVEGHAEREPLATALARPLIAQLLVEVAAREGADAIAAYPVGDDGTLGEPSTVMSSATESTSSTIPYSHASCGVMKRSRSMPASSASRST